MAILIVRLLSLAALPLLLSCSGWRSGWLTTVGPDYKTPALPTENQWHSLQGNEGIPIAHHGDPTNLKRWWDRFNDPVLGRLLLAAQEVNASIAMAKANIEQARARFIDANASALPNLDLNASVNYTAFNINNIGISGRHFSIDEIDLTLYKVGVQSSWEIDIFGGLARQWESTQSQLESRTASWHDARVAVAVEVANAYLQYRFCEAQVKLMAADTASRDESSRLLRIIGQAGFSSPADVALAQASAADGSQNLLNYKAQCEHSVKGLVKLTGMEERAIRKLLTGTPERVAKLPSPPPFEIDSLPARVLLQRPDLAAAERDMAEASANIGVERAKQFPKLSLTGNISRILANIDLNVISSVALGLQAWSIGPSLSLPLFDAGRRAANTRSAQAQYDASVVKFRDKVRTAVKEVEDALVRLDSVGKRLPLARLAAAEYKKNFLAQENLYKNGLGNLIDTEASRRSVLSAEMTVVQLEQERVGAWIALYRAAGGSWDDTPSLSKSITDASHDQKAP